MPDESRPHSRAWPMQPEFSHVRGCLTGYAPATGLDALDRIECQMADIEEQLESRPTWEDYRALNAAEARLQEQLETERRRVRFCPYCAGGVVDVIEGPCPGCQRAEAFARQRDELQEQYQALHLAAEAVYRSGYSGMGGRFVNDGDMEALGAVLYPASVREEVRAIEGPLSPDELEEVVTRALDSFGGSNPASRPPSLNEREGNPDYPFRDSTWDEPESNQDRDRDERDPAKELNDG